MQQLTMPNVGEGVTEGTVTRWLKQPGDAVHLDEPIVEIETDKAVVEIPCPFEGRLGRVLVAEGEVVPIGTLLAEFETDATVEAIGADGTAANSMTQDGPQATGTATASIAAPDGRGVADSVGRGNDAVPPSNGTAGEANGANGAIEAEYPRTRRYSPVVQKLASEHDIDLALVRGTGIEGRVTRKDVLRYVENPAANTVPASATVGVVGVEHGGAQEPRTKTQESGAGSTAGSDPEVVAALQDVGPHALASGDEVIPLSSTRRAIAAHMTQSHQAIPVAWMVVEADVTGLVALRVRTKDEFRRVEGLGLTYLPFFVQVIVAALERHPEINATFTDEGVVRHRRHDIGIAVAAEAGLVVPVIRSAGDLSIAGLARALESLGAKARTRKLSLDEMRGATFTIDNTGSFGSVMSQPIVPSGQVAIVTTEAIRRELRPGDAGSFGVRSVMNLCVSFDHRALDGAEVGRFLRTAREGLEALT